MTKHRALLDMRQAVSAGAYRHEYTPRRHTCGWLGTERSDLAAASSEGLRHEQEAEG